MIARLIEVEVVEVEIVDVEVVEAEDVEVGVVEVEVVEVGCGDHWTGLGAHFLQARIDQDQDQDS